MDAIRGEIVDIIEWLDDSRDTIVWRFPRYENEIKHGAQLIVRESQTAVFVDQGRIADVFVPGRYELTTQNLPILSTLRGWKYGFDSPFKCEVYFVSTRLFTELKWGTQNPVIVRDPEFGMVRLRAFGAYAVRVVDAPKLLRELAGTDGRFRTDEVAEYLRQVIVGRLGNALASAKIPMLDLAANQHEIGGQLAKALSVELEPMGLQIPSFTIENISVPPEVEEALDKRTQMGIVGNLDQYAKFQTANAMEAAAENPSGGAATGVGFGLGMAAGQQMTQSFGVGATPSAASTAAPAGPPPLPAQEQWYVGVGGERKGPYDLAGLSAQAQSGALTAATLVWKTGMAQWLPAQQVPELASVLGSVPPPLPPS